MAFKRKTTASLINVSSNYILNCKILGTPKKAEEVNSPHL